MFDPISFLEELFTALDLDGIDVSTFELDHLCYRVETLDRYDGMKRTLADEGTLLGEHMIGGRPISTYRLHEPIKFRERSIAVIELPAPKHGSQYPEGFEHAEFVVDMEPIDFADRYPAMDWDLSGSRKAINADVRLNYDGFSAKFHRQGLAEVIMLEKDENN